MIQLKDIIIPKFYELHKAIKNNDFKEYWLKGGRSSTKSSFTAIEIVLGIIKNPNAHCCCFRKVGDTLKSSVFNQILWAINILEVQDYFAYTTNPLQITYIPTGQTIIFRGLDKPEKIKSIKPVFGYFKYAWFEELAEFDGMEQVRNVIQSLQRGGEKYVYFFTYNPPINANNWVNQEAEIKKENRLVMSSTYLDVPVEWLGEEFIIEANFLKNQNELAYRHEYLGEATGTGLQVFNNVKNITLTQEEIKEFDNIKEGIDWGFAVDPFAFVKLHYDRTRRSIYIYDEIYKVGIGNKEAMELVKKKHSVYSTIIADSAEPKSIREFYDNGFAIRECKKGDGSRRYSYKFLQELANIYIDNTRCPNTYRELIEYEFEKLKDGTVKSDYPDGNDHCLDALRYSLNDEMPFTRKG